jgi:hypothetical protein
LVDENCYYYSHLNLNGKRITAKGFSYLFGKIELSGKSSFTVTIANMNKFIGIGIVDANHNYKISLSRQ